ncbi:unnamed protein product [Rotaria sp. Silwood2]|nr:unnamed protein product [Rotaria sp. Silwood2]CAF4060024.1 unnamed protein product [Rotaria sp. Silwood2]
MAESVSIHFDDYKSNYSSLNEFIQDFYLRNQYKPTTLTCYNHLQCNRGVNSTCLDWSEICDGKIDCLNDAVDEEQCWLFELNECQNEEFRCNNGQCISEIFLRDNPNNSYCLDESNEIFSLTSKRYNCDIFEPSFERTELLLQAIFFDNLKSISDDYWSAFKCIIYIPTLRNLTCPRIICEICPDMLLLPAGSILFGLIYLAYTKNESQYIRYNDQLCNGFFFQT